MLDSITTGSLFYKSVTLIIAISVAISALDFCAFPVANDHALQRLAWSLIPTELTFVIQLKISIDE